MRSSTRSPSAVPGPTDVRVEYLGPVPEEARILNALLEADFAVTPGECFRLCMGPAIRITIATLAPEDAELLVEATAGALRSSRRMRSTIYST